MWTGDWSSDVCSSDLANDWGTVFRYQLATSAVPSDFNGDGHPDLLFQNASSGQLAVWYMNGITPTGGEIGRASCRERVWVKGVSVEVNRKIEEVEAGR